MPTLAVYAGSFDPPTRGHVWMIEQGARLFGRLIVAVGVNPEKRATFPLQTRLAWLREIVRPWANAEVAHFENLFLARYAAEVGADFILRGIRNVADYTYEQAMRHINSDLHPQLTTVFLMPPRELGEISSSTVRGMIGPAGWHAVVQRYVPECVFATLEQTHGR
ncbi:MAG: pantetheine-phosphate adenylyltransferase [Planctomycetota bacterium]